GRTVNTSRQFRPRAAGPAAPWWRRQGKPAAAPQSEENGTLSGSVIVVDEALKARIDADVPRVIEDLRRLVKIPSVAAQRRGIPETVQAVSDILRDAGGRVTVLDHEDANPVVVAEF